MILSELRSCLKEKQRVTLHDLVLHFNTDAEALRGMLHVLMTKGYVVKNSINEACGTSCCKCESSLTEIYEYREK